MEKLKRFKEHDLLPLRDVIMNAVVDVMNRELAEEDYLNQKDYNSCFDRANAGWQEVGKEVIPFVAKKIALHRQESHNEDHSKELKNYAASKESEVGFWFD